MRGVDLTRIDGIDVTTARVAVSEIGVDTTRFPRIKHFTRGRPSPPPRTDRRASTRC